MKHKGPETTGLFQPQTGAGVLKRLQVAKIQNVSRTEATEQIHFQKRNLFLNSEENSVFLMLFLAPVFLFLFRLDHLEAGIWNQSQKIENRVRDEIHLLEMRSKGIMATASFFFDRSGFEMPVDSNLLTRLHQAAIGLDQSDAWPQQQFQWLAEKGILGEGIPQEFGGCPISKQELLSEYEQLSAACLTTSLILTQRNGACQRLSGCSNDQLKQKLLPALARGELFATVGISHLTTSRQHVRTPAVAAEFSGDLIRLNGTIPWVTGAAQAQYVVTGGTCHDGRQVLVALPTQTSGVAVLPHAQLMAMTASQTASIELRDVSISSIHLLAGPVNEVMKQGQGGGTGSQVTSTLALGLSRRMLDLLQQQAEIRPDLIDVADCFETELNRLRKDLYQSVLESSADPEALPSIPATAAEIRERANSLVLRISQAAMAVSKGAGYVRGHPAELAVREAMFFLVWSCPQPVIHSFLSELTCQQ